jgi:tRNA threonylcarbamoyl adenosine modification protein YeaZ
MKILAVEFSSQQRSVAVAQGSRTAAGLQLCEVVEAGGIFTKPIAMTDEVLRQAGLEREQIDCVAVGLGPGSYTGIRMAIALAQGWQLAREVKLAGISSAECIAAEAHAQGLQGSVAVVIDAQRQEFYLATYQLEAAGFRELSRLQIVSAAEVKHRASRSVLIGPEVRRWFPEGRVVFPRATTLARLALDHTDSVPGERLEPIYLRETSFVKAPPPGRPV